MASFWWSYCWLWTNFTHSSRNSIADIKQINASWVATTQSWYLPTKIRLLSLLATFHIYLSGTHFLLWTTIFMQYTTLLKFQLCCWLFRPMKLESKPQIKIVRLSPAVDMFNFRKQKTKTCEKAQFQKNSENKRYIIQLWQYNIYFFKFNNRNIRKRCEISSKLTIKTSRSMTSFWCFSCSFWTHFFSV